jgi:hypothetical protein
MWWTIWMPRALTEKLAGPAKAFVTLPLEVRMPYYIGKSKRHAG